MIKNSEYYSGHPADQLCRPDASALLANFEKLIHALSTGKGLQAITDIGSEILENPVAIADTTGKVLAYADKYRDLNYINLSSTAHGAALIDSISNNQISPQSFKFLRVSKRRELMYKINEPHIVSVEDMDRLGIESPCSFLDCGIRIKGILVAMFSVADTNRPFTPGDVDYCRRLVDLAAIELQKKEIFQDNYGINYEMLMTDLLEGRVSDGLQVKLRLQSMDKTLKPDLYVLTVRHMDPEFSHDQIPKIQQSAVRSCFPGSISVNYRGDIVLLLSLDPGVSVKSLMTEKFLGMLDENDLKAAVSEVFHDPVKMSKYFDQSVRALEFGTVIYPDRAYYMYYDLSFFHGMDICSKSMNLRDMSHPVINALNFSKDPRDHDLLKTLYVWLFCARSTKRATALLHINSSTLYYRLDRIKDLLGDDDLSDGEVIFKLMFSFKLVEYYNGLVNDKASYWFNDIKI